MFSTAETVLRHGDMFQGSDEVKKPLLHDSGQAIRFALTCLYSVVYLEKFSMKSLLLKLLDFGLQRPTGPTVGVKKKFPFRIVL